MEKIGDFRSCERTLKSRTNSWIESVLLSMMNLRLRRRAATYKPRPSEKCIVSCWNKNCRSSERYQLQTVEVMDESCSSTCLRLPKCGDCAVADDGPYTVGFDCQRSLGRDS